MENNLDIINNFSTNTINKKMKKTNNQNNIFGEILNNVAKNPIDKTNIFKALEDIQTTSLISSTDETKEAAKIKAKLDAIISKLLAGIPLNSEEIKFIKQYAPGLLAKAEEVKKASLNKKK